MFLVWFKGFSVTEQGIPSQTRFFHITSVSKFSSVKFLMLFKSKREFCLWRAFFAVENAFGCFFAKIIFDFQKLSWWQNFLSLKVFFGCQILFCRVPLLVWNWFLFPDLFSLKSGSFVASHLTHLSLKTLLISEHLIINHGMRSQEPNSYWILELIFNCLHAFLIPELFSILKCPLVW